MTHARGRIEGIETLHCQHGCDDALGVSTLCNVGHTLSLMEGCSELSIKAVKHLGMVTYVSIEYEH